MPNGVKRLLVLQLLIRQKFHFQFEAARALDIRDDELSRYIAGRKEMPEKLIIRLERLLGCDRDTFLSVEPLKAAPRVYRVRD